MAGEIEILVSCGEVIDRITILEIKMENISDKGKLENIQREFNYLNSVLASSDINLSGQIMNLKAELCSVNKRIWDGENVVRACDNSGNFGLDFIDVACKIRRWNDQRAKLKRDINKILGSTIIEEKGHSI